VALVSKQGELMRVLVLADDYWHPARTPRAGLAPLEGGEFTFDWIEDASEWSVERMAEYPVVLLTKSNDVSAADRTPWVTPAVEEAFRAYVANGGGLLAIHSGTTGYRETPVLRRLLGGVFVQHPPQCEVTITPTAGHPLAAGVESFTIKDEHYHMEMESLEVASLLTTTSEHGAQPGGWTHTEGAGRVCVLTPGHNPEVWLHPAYQTLIGNALRWCGAAAQG
jgi:type 1 glutamine amidotransferase